MRSMQFLNPIFLVLGECWLEDFNRKKKPFNHREFKNASNGNLTHTQITPTIDPSF